jgi:hypothetical protein
MLRELHLVGTSYIIIGDSSTTHMRDQTIVLMQVTLATSLSREIAWEIEGAVVCVFGQYHPFRPSYSD